MNKEYVLKAVFVPKSMRTTTSPCDLCERDVCIGVDDCSLQYGDDYTFVKVFKVKSYNSQDDE